MNIIKLKKLLSEGKIVLMNGGTGSEITARGVKTTLPLWSAQALFTHPDVVKQIHRDYIDAGAQIVVTNTFRTTKRTFKKAGLTDYQAKKAVMLACKLAKEAVKESGNAVIVAGSIAPLEDCYSPRLVPPLKDLKKEHSENVQNLKKGGIDFILAETMISINEVISVCQATNRVGLPLAVSFCCNAKGELLSGESLQDAVEKVGQYRPLFISLNCMSLKSITRVAKKLRKITDLPIGICAQGDGEVDDNQGWIGGGTKAVNDYVKEARKWKKIGVQIIGGCCGTNPEHIKKISLACNLTVGG